MDNKEERKTFTFYASFEEAISAIDQSDKSNQLALYRAICRYALYKEEPKLKGIANIVWRVIKPTLDAQWIKYHNGCKGAESGKLGGAPKGNKNASKTTPKQPLNNPYPLLKDKDIDKDIDKDKEHTTSVCVNNNAHPHDYNDVLLYVSENFLDVESAKQWYTYRTAKGWQGVENWQADLAFWCRKDEASNEAKGRRGATKADIMEMVNDFINEK